MQNILCSLVIRHFAFLSILYFHVGPGGWLISTQCVLFMRVSECLSLIYYDYEQTWRKLLCQVFCEILLCGPCHLSICSNSRCWGSLIHLVDRDTRVSSNQPLYIQYHHSVVPNTLQSMDNTCQVPLSTQCWAKINRWFTSTSSSGRFTIQGLKRSLLYLPVMCSNRFYHEPLGSPSVSLNFFWLHGTVSWNIGLCQYLLFRTLEKSVHLILLWIL